MVSKMGNVYVCRKLGESTRKFLGELTSYTHEDDYKELKESLCQLANELEEQARRLAALY